MEVDFNDYQLRCVLRGHEDDVRFDANENSECFFHFMRSHRLSHHTTITYSISLPLWNMNLGFSRRFFSLIYLIILRNPI